MGGGGQGGRGGRGIFFVCDVVVEPFFFHTCPVSKLEWEMYEMKKRTTKWHCQNVRVFSFSSVFFLLLFYFIFGKKTNDVGFDRRVDVRPMPRHAVRRRCVRFGSGGVDGRVRKKKSKIRPFFSMQNGFTLEPGRYGFVICGYQLAEWLGSVRIRWFSRRQMVGAIFWGRSHRYNLDDLFSSRQ